MSIVFFLTEIDGWTGLLQWGANVTHSLPNADFEASPTSLLAAMKLTPDAAGGCIQYPRLWRAEFQGDSTSDGLVVRGRSLKTISETGMPAVTWKHRAAFGLLCAKVFCDDAEFIAWANAWLANEDRSDRTALIAQRSVERRIGGTPEGHAAADAIRAARYAVAVVHVMLCAKRALKYGIDNGITVDFASLAALAAAITS